MKKRSAFLIFFLFLTNVVAQNISTIAGGGPRNIPALQTGITPAGLAVDASGNLFVSVLQSNQIWKVDTSGNVTVFAGTGATLFNGDGIQAASASLSGPHGLAFDTAGNLYVADSDHERVRRISTSGVISSVAGTGTNGFTGDGGTATSAQLNHPLGVVVDSANNLYIADELNNRVRMVSASGTITTLAGNGALDSSGDGGAATAGAIGRPNSVAVDSSGTVYVGEPRNFRVRKVAAGILSTVAGTGVLGPAGDGGPATVARVGYVSGVLTDQFQNLYIIEQTEVRIIAAGQSNIAAYAGAAASGDSGDGASPINARFTGLSAMALDSSGGTAYLADLFRRRVRRIASGTISAYAGNGTANYGGEGLPAVNANFINLRSVAVNNAGSLLISDGASPSIRRVVLSSGLLSTAAGNGVGGATADGAAVIGPIDSSASIAYDPNGSDFYFLEGNRVRKVSGGIFSTVANTAGTAGFSGDGGLATGAQFNSPQAVAVAQNGDLYVADTSNRRIRLISRQTGIVTTIAGVGVTGSRGDGGPATSAGLFYPSSLALDGAGNLFIGDFTDLRVRKVALASNLISTVAGDGTDTYADGVPATSTGIAFPYGVFADESSNLFIADQGHARVRRVAAGTNVITTVAGNGVQSFSGDGGSATAASTVPLALTVDRAQNLYIADGSGRVRITQVMACFFTFSTPVVYVNSSGGSGSMMVTATNSSCPYNVSSSLPFVTITSGASGMGSGTVTFSIAADPGLNRTATVLVGGASFTVRQAGVIGQYNVGFFQPSNGPVWALDANGNGLFDGLSGDKYFTFAGQAGVKAVVGDWNGDGRTKVGYFVNGFWILDYNGNGTYDGTGVGGDKIYGFGGSDASFVPVVGDWNGDGRTKIGYYRNGFWILDMNGTGTYDAGDALYGFGGAAGEAPLVGDWNGDGRTKVGVFANGTWILDYNGDGNYHLPEDRYYTFAYSPGDLPVTGDWSGDRKAKIGLYRNGFWILDYNGNGSYDGIGAGADRFYGFGGRTGDVPIVADWNGDGLSKIGIYNSGFWTLDFNGNGGYDGTGAGGDRIVAYGGTPGNQPLVGRW